ncbi:arrestin domain-containing protein 3-like isoform X1 [Parambassis ranga]|uniref:Arrestin domain-containing protein 3-like isoform X1 n=1 Tax=Parambassis ranga TaxID=210632 RepID=A0A6P7J2E4_9TELE|nr:arrestin domain-containing protein 3-like isoform X1 [Parambassis ranga]
MAARRICRIPQKKKYFSIKQRIIKESLGNNIIALGCHVYPFTFQIPAQDLPSSFRGTHGNIMYTLEAVLSRFMRVDSKAKEMFTVLHKESLGEDSILMTKQHGTVDKKRNIFSSGSVSMDVNITRTAFHPGEGIKVVAYIHNKSSRDIKPKYSLYQKHSFFAKGERKLETKEILKDVGEAIPPSASQTVTRIITIPPATCMSILNCSIIKVEYRLKVYLGVKYGSNPGMKFPIVILPAVEVTDEEQPAAYPAYGFEAFANSAMPGGTMLQQHPTAYGPTAPPPPYATYGLYPPLNDSDKKY